MIAITILSSSVFSQVDDGSKTKKSKAKVKAIVSNIPSKMVAGQTYDVTVTVTNKSKKDNWTSGMIRTEIIGPFQITKLSNQDLSLSPGESVDLKYKITAPLETGKHKLTVVFYKTNESDNRIGRKTKKISVYSTADDLNKSGDSDDDSMKEKDKNKEKFKTKTKNKETEKD